MDKIEWMSKLPDRVRNYPIINLAIPGSHNSMTYGITSESDIAPDAEPSIRRLNYVFPCLVRRWAITQSATLPEQLSMGVRYFDMRIAHRNGLYYYVHALFAMEVFEPLCDIKCFINKHPGEIVILDFQHFYDMPYNRHRELQNKLLSFFESHLYSVEDGPLSECTLNSCRDLNKQIILIYRRSPIMLPKEFWPSSAWPTPWPNVASFKKLKSFLEDSLLSRHSSKGYVSQCILTPNNRYIALRFLSSLRKTAKKVDDRLHPWIANQCPGPFSDCETPTANVFIADFVNLRDGQFCNWIIDLNLKLCE